MPTEITREMLSAKTELVPIVSSQKSFWRKAYVVSDEIGCLYLYSYKTLVAVHAVGHEVKKVWSGWSDTTWKHIKSFCALCDAATPTKAEWLSQTPATFRKVDTGTDSDVDFVTGDFVYKWTDAKTKRFFRSIGGREYRRGDWHYTRDPSGVLRHKVRFDSLYNVAYM